MHYTGNAGSFDVGVGGHTVTIFADTPRRARAAVGQLRRRSQAAPPARLAPPAYPYRVRQELKRVLVARKRSPTAPGDSTADRRARQGRAHASGPGQAGWREGLARNPGAPALMERGGA